MTDDSTPASKAEGIQPWTIKGIEPEARNAAIAAAKREGSALGPWIAAAIRQKIKADRNAPKGLTTTGQPTVRPSDQGADYAAELVVVGRLTEAVQRMSDAGSKPPEDVQKAMWRRIKRVAGRRGHATDALPYLTAGPISRSDPTEPQSDPD